MGEVGAFMAGGILRDYGIGLLSPEAPQRIASVAELQREIGDRRIASYADFFPLGNQISLHLYRQGMLEQASALCKELAEFGAHLLRSGLAHDELVGLAIQPIINFARIEGLAGQLDTAWAIHNEILGFARTGELRTMGISLEDVPSVSVGGPRSFALRAMDIITVDGAKFAFRRCAMDQWADIAERLIERRAAFPAVTPWHAVELLALGGRASAAAKIERHSTFAMLLRLIDAASNGLDAPEAVDLLASAVSLEERFGSMAAARPLAMLAYVAARCGLSEVASLAAHKASTLAAAGSGLAAALIREFDLEMDRPGEAADPAVVVALGEQFSACLRAYPVSAANA